jgi:hypothetical protein
VDPGGLPHLRAPFGIEPALHSYTQASQAAQQGEKIAIDAGKRLEHSFRPTR